MPGRGGQLPEGQLANGRGDNYFGGMRLVVLSPDSGAVPILPQLRPSVIPLPPKPAPNRLQRGARRIFAAHYCSLYSGFAALRPYFSRKRLSPRDRGPPVWPIMRAHWLSNAAPSDSTTGLSAH